MTDKKNRAGVNLLDIPRKITEWVEVNITDGLDGLVDWDQIMFMRDKLAGHLFWDEYLDDVKVISHHFSKNCKLPVVRIIWHGIHFIMRHNFFNWKLSIQSDAGKIVIPELEQWSVGSLKSPIYYEGFPRELVFDDYKEDQETWSVELSTKYEVYTYLWLIKTWALKQDRDTRSGIVPKCDSCDRAMVAIMEKENKNVVDHWECPTLCDLEQLLEELVKHRIGPGGEDLYDCQECGTTFEATKWEERELENEGPVDSDLVRFCTACGVRRWQ